MSIFVWLISLFNWIFFFYFLNLTPPQYQISQALWKTNAQEMSPHPLGWCPSPRSGTIYWNEPVHVGLQCLCKNGKWKKKHIHLQFSENSQLCQFLKKKKESISELLLGETIFAPQEKQNMCSVSSDIYLKVRKQRSRLWMNVGEGQSFPLLSLSLLFIYGRSEEQVWKFPQVSTLSVYTFVYGVSCVFFFFPSDKSDFLSSSHLETREEGNGRANC